MTIPSRGTPEFWRLYRALPFEARTLARKNYRLWSANAFHPSNIERRTPNVEAMPLPKFKFRSSEFRVQCLSPGHPFLTTDVTDGHGSGGGVGISFLIRVIRVIRGCSSSNSAWLLGAIAVGSQHQREPIPEPGRAALPLHLEGASYLPVLSSRRDIGAERQLRPAYSCDPRNPWFFLSASL